MNTNDGRIWAEGMDEDARVDIQPGPEDLHNKLQSCTPEDMQSIAGPGVDQTDLENAATAMQQLSAVITGPESIVANLRSDYIHRSSSPHVARLHRQSTPSQQLGRLPVGYDLAFHISFRDGLRCTMLGKDQAVQLVETIRAASPNGFLGIDWGDVWDNVTDSVYGVTDVIVHVINDAVKVVVQGISLIEEGFQWAWNGVVQLATEIADIASSVFSYIKATWDKIIAWLGFLFDWDDIKRTANAFQDMVHDAGASLQVGLLLCVERNDLTTSRASSTIQLHHSQTLSLTACMISFKAGLKREKRTWVLTPQDNLQMRH
jgi:hypothetical protein